tara:strand:+ start:2296 stop:2916 length:621 start_codon:yes stop_codon:yes gene_type:complete
MAISTFTELKASIANFLNRDDLTATIPDFISLAESSINNEIRHWRMETRAETTLDSQFIGIPSDWLSTIRFHLVTDGTTSLDFMSLATIQSARSARNDSTGTPTNYSLNSSQFELMPTPDGDYSAILMYYAKIPTLSDSVETNWLLTHHPDIYLYGALLHSAPYLKEDERAQTWASLYTAAVVRVNNASSKSTTSGSGLRLKIGSY